MKREAETLCEPIPRTQTMLGGISRASVYRRIADGTLEPVKIGNRTMITTRSIRRLVGGQA